MKHVRYLILAIPFMLSGHPSSKQPSYNQEALESLDPVLRDQIKALIQQAHYIAQQEQPAAQEKTERKQKQHIQKNDNEQQKFMVSITTAVVGKFVEAMMTEDPMPLVDAFGTALSLIAKRRNIRIDDELLDAIESAQEKNSLPDNAQGTKN